MSTTFRIATWNLDHPKRANRLPEQLEQMAKISADIIIVLTETSPDADLSHITVDPSVKTIMHRV